MLGTWTFFRGVLAGGPLLVGWGFQPGDPDMKVLAGFFWFPRQRELLEFLLQVYEEVPVCALEPGCWFRGCLLTWTLRCWTFGRSHGVISPG